MNTCFHQEFPPLKKNHNFLNLLIFCINCRWSIVFVNLFCKSFLGVVVLCCGVGDVCVVVGKKWAALPCEGSAAVVYFLIPILGIVKLAGVLVILPPLLLCR